MQSNKMNSRTYNSFQSLDLGKSRTSLEHLTQAVEIYNTTNHLVQVPAYHQRTYNTGNGYDDPYSYDRFADNIYHQTYNMPFVNNSVVNILPPISFVNGTGLFANQVIGNNAGVAQQDIFPRYAKKTGTAPRTVNSKVVNKTASDKEKMDIVYYKNLFSADGVTESKVEDASLYFKGMFENAKVGSQPSSGNNTKDDVSDDKEENVVPDVVSSVVNNVICDLKDIHDEQIISGNVCSKLIHLPPEIVQPEVHAQAENVPGMLESRNENFFHADTKRVSTPIPANTAEKSSSAVILRPNRAISQYVSRPGPFAGESMTFQLCEFYRTTPIDDLKQHLSNRWKFNQRCECCGESPSHFAVRLNSVELINILAK